MSKDGYIKGDHIKKEVTDAIDDFHKSEAYQHLLAATSEYELHENLSASALKNIDGRIDLEDDDKVNIIHEDKGVTYNFKPSGNDTFVFLGMEAHEGSQSMGGASQYRLSYFEEYMEKGDKHEDYTEEYLVVDGKKHVHRLVNGNEISALLYTSPDGNIINKELTEWASGSETFQVHVNDKKLMIHDENEPIAFLDDGRDKVLYLQGEDKSFLNPYFDMGEKGYKGKDKQLISYDSDTQTQASGWVLYGQLFKDSSKADILEFAEAGEENPQALTDMLKKATNAATNPIDINIKGEPQASVDNGMADALAQFEAMDEFKSEHPPQVAANAPQKDIAQGRA